MLTPRRGESVAPTWQAAPTMASSAPSSQRPRASGVRSEHLRAWAPQLVLAGAIGFLCWCALSAIARPGLQYDEALFVNAALGGHYAGGSFVADRLLGIPTMVMPYSGALKSWLYAPVFQLLGVSVTTIRLPAVALLVATVALAFVVARRLFGPWPAALLALLMATDPAFMTMAKADWGPVALSALLRVAALAAYFAWARTESIRYLWLLAAAVVLGIFNKLDYLAFAGALAFAVAVVDHRGVYARLRRRTRAVAVALAALATVLVVEYVEIYEPARDFPAARSNADLLGRAPEVWRLLRTTMDGSAIYQYMTALPLAHGTAVVAVGVFVVVVAIGFSAWRLGRLGQPPAAAAAPLVESARLSAFVLLLLLATVAALVLTPEAVGPHHAMLLWPLPALLGVSLVSAATRLPRARVRAAAVIVVTLPLLWLAGTQVRVAETYRSTFASDRSWSPIWTTEIYAVVDAVRRAAPGADHVVTADWGFGNQLIALGDDAVRQRLDDTWSTFAGGSEDAIDQLAATDLRGHRSIVVLHASGSEIMPGTHDRAMAMLRALHPARGVHALYRGRVELAYLVDDSRSAG
jgi:Dolichyl-phosphate-mannose-protein mannosyltransferase